MTVTAKDQTIDFGSEIATGVDQIEATGLGSGESISSITLTPSTSEVTTDGTITPSDAVIMNGETDITEDFVVTYTAGKLIIQNVAPAFASSNTYEITASKGKTATLELKSSAGANLTWSLENNPSWFSINATTGVITVTPGMSTAGTKTFTIKLSNEVDNVTQIITLNVTDADLSQLTDAEKANYNLNEDNEDEGTPSVKDPVVNSENNTISRTTTTTFKNSSGNVALSADITITTESGDWASKVSEDFSKVFSVDVKINLIDTDYKNYSFSMDVPALPDGLSIEGDVSEDATLTDSEEINYSLKISGTPKVSFDDAVNLKATVKIDGSTLGLVAYASCDVEIVIAEADAPNTPGTGDTTPGTGDEPGESLAAPELEITVTGLNSSDYALSGNQISISSDLTLAQSLLTVTVTQTEESLTADDFDWLTEGTLPAGVTGSYNGGVFTVSGQISTEAETKTYNFAVTASNDTGNATANIIFNVYKFVTVDFDSSTGKVTINLNTDALTEEEATQGVSFTEILASLNTTVSDITKITEIKIPDGVKDLTGLSSLTGLKNLDVTETAKLVEVDLSGTNVESIDLSGSNISTLKLGSSVKTVEAQNSKLEALDIKGNTAIEAINISGTPIKSLDASDCANLQKIICESAPGEGNLEELIITPNENLVTLRCGGNKLLYLDLSKEDFPNLTEASYDNQIRIVQSISRSFNLWEWLFYLMFGYNPGADENLPFTKGNFDGFSYYDNTGATHDAEFNSDTGDINLTGNFSGGFGYRYNTRYSVGRTPSGASVKTADNDSDYMNVKINTSATSQNESDGNIGPSGAGCNNGGEFLTSLSILLGFALLRGKRQ